MNPAVFPNNPIVFPGLGFQINPDPILVTIGPFVIHWYGVLIAAGFLLAALYALKRAPKFGVKSDHFVNILLIAIPVAIICARIYYVMFNLSLYENNPLGVFEIWKGGIAIYGAIIGAVVTVFLYCKIAKISAMNILDIGALGLLIGQCIGRWGNFMNREAYGSVTDLPWRMEIYDAAQQARMAVHPAFLYESLWTLIGFVVLHFYSKKRRFSGEIFLLYAAWYGLGRAFIEGLRADSEYFWGTDIRVSQVVAVITCVVAVGLWVYFRFVRKAGICGDKRDLLAGSVDGGAVTADSENGFEYGVAAGGDDVAHVEASKAACDRDMPPLERVEAVEADSAVTADSETGEDSE